MLKRAKSKLLSELKELWSGLAHPKWTSQRFQSPPADAALSDSVPDSEPPSTDHYVRLPFRLVYEQMPENVRAKILYVGPEPDIPVPPDLVVPQLQQDIIKIQFGSLRKAAPDLFLKGNDLDDVWISLPAAKVRSRMISGRSPQKSPEPERKHPSQARSQPSTSATPDAKPAPRSTALPQHDSRPVSKPESAPTPTARANQNNKSRRPGAQIPAKKTELHAKSAPMPFGRGTTPEAAPSSQDVLKLNLAELMVEWPQAIQQEIADAKLSAAVLMLPMDTATQGMKRGQLLFTWKAIRGWTTPSFPNKTSPHEAQSLTLPLKIVAPIFMATQSKPSKRPQMVVADDIPPMFAGVSSASPTEKPLPQASEPVAPPSNDAKPTQKSPEKQESSPALSEGTTLTPHQLVFHASALPGVHGALIALSDGLLVNARVPAGMSGDKVAGFAPQIYHRLNESVSQLQPGKITRLRFCIEEVPWEITRVDKIFFIAFGRAGEPFPEEKLADLLKKLNRSF